jgi:hypothetical protein
MVVGAQPRSHHLFSALENCNEKITIRRLYNPCGYDTLHKDERSLLAGISYAWH